MTESVEDFLAKGGKIETIPEGQQTFKRISDHKRHIEKKKTDAAFTEHQMKRAENETDCKKPYYDNDN